jgi:hypothetical protein
MQSKATSPTAYINELPADRKPIIKEIRKAILDNLPAGFKEVMSYGMLGYVVPHSVYPKGYHVKPEQPLPLINLASQKNYISLYHMGLYKGALLDWFLKEWSLVSVKKPDMGKCCIRFKKTDKIPLELIGKLAGKLTPDQWIFHYEKAAGIR